MRGGRAEEAARRRERGFTLLELIVVMVLLALTVSFAAPRLTGFLFSSPVQTGARRLIGLVHQASLLAQREQAAYLLRYDEAGHCFVLEPEQAARPGTEDAHRRESLSLDTTVQVGLFWSWYGGRRGGEQRTLRFSQEGYTEPAVITLRDDRDREMSVIVPPFVGKVQVVAAHVEPDETLFAR